ncbi:hypothetical protein L210DRAFT_3085910 [Boletus edulis BED1]|uniref:Secreted protein n=1 Tax=Boletus edulis BED1 TaxID=1328754 RepID=A0AAD4BH39_BOLED|nr:hypothetical protein L210DRAFT_3085910 [Boletus edulis BED1]
MPKFGVSLLGALAELSWKIIALSALFRSTDDLLTTQPTLLTDSTQFHTTRSCSRRSDSEPRSRRNTTANLFPSSCRWRSTMTPCRILPATNYMHGSRCLASSPTPRRSTLQRRSLPSTAPSCPIQIVHCRRSRSAVC